jgi:putative DNA primase/helicase
MDAPPSNTRINFEDLAERLLARSRDLLSQWFPSGKFRGREFVVGNLAGDEGESLSINLDTGKWADFANRELAGGDLISLYAAKHNLKQSEAARELDPQIAPTAKTATTSTPAEREGERWRVLLPVPDGAAAPPDRRSIKINDKWERLTFTKRWAYRDEHGQLLGYVVRFKKPDGTKDIAPQTFCRSESGKQEWKWKSWPLPRPLYGLELLAQHRDRPVMIVEGEKSADAARELVGDRYVVIAWPGGIAGVKHADWRAVYGRAVLLWPDADKVGQDGMRVLAGVLYGHCPEIKIIDSTGQPDGWDAADAIAQAWTWSTLAEWARPRATPYKPADVVDLNEQRQARAAPADPPPARPAFVSQRQVWDNFGLDLNGNGVPLANLNNALKLFEQHPELAGVVCFDEFHQKFFHRDGHEWRDVDELNVTAWMQRAIGVLRMPTALVHDAAVIVARRATLNEPRDWMDALEWDGEERIEHFLTDGFGSAGTEYARAASRNFWIALVARVYRPGCRMRHVLVLESPQDLGKSTALSIIGGTWYAEASESVTSKDFFMALQGKILVEIAELDSFSRAEVTRIKQVISAPKDRFRPPYARAPADFPRTCIFVGTTNENEYLRDSTGGTRFWPIKCGELRLDLIADQREQLFAEAVAKFKAGSTWWEMPRQETEAEQEARRQADSWEEVVDDWLRRQMYTETTVQQVMHGALGIDVAKQDKATQMRVAGVLRVLGWSRVTRRDGSKTAKLWVKGGRLV